MENVISNNNKSVRIKKVIRILSILCIAVLWVSIMAIAEIYGGAFLRKNILSLLGQSKTYEKGYEYYQKQVETVKQPISLPLDQVYDVMSQQRFYVTKLNFAEHALDGKRYEYEEGSLQSELCQYLCDYLRNGSEELSIQDEQEVSSYAKTIVNLFYQNADSQFLDSIYRLKIQFLDCMKWLLPILLLCTLQFIGALFHIHSNKERAMRDICYAGIVSVLLALTMYIGLSIWLRTENFMTGPDFYQSFIQSYLSKINQTFGYGIWLLALVYCLLIAVKQLLAGYQKKSI